MSLLQDKLAKYTAPQEVKAQGVYPYFRAIESDQDTEVTMNGRKVLMFGSNAYTGLTNHPKVKEASMEMTRRYGTGCAGSRFLNGTLDIHVALEERLAKFVGKEEALVFSTGFFANMGTVSCLTGREDYIIWDELDHASIIEGKRLSMSQSFKFRHTDMESLEKVLAKCEPDRVKLIVV
ncbi:MAG: pyridoxal phosphate-dependent aminotransferase family protein, partial [Bacteroidales bacterium]|nr:pyridoxal phosphate-dependent aminotransferase family protein [Bacteroidales bacterium]